LPLSLSFLSQWAAEVASFSELVFKHSQSAFSLQLLLVQSEVQEFKKQEKPISQAFWSPLAMLL